MGVKGQLLDESLQTLQIFMIMALVFPFVDFFNGFLMLQRQTKVTIVSQSTNLIITVIVLFLGVKFNAGWNGSIGALAQSVGLLAELIVVASIVKYLKADTSMMVVRKVTSKG